METGDGHEVAARGTEVLMKRLLLTVTLLLAGCGGDTTSLDPLAGGG